MSEEPVGYRNPPRHSQFKKGQKSPNPGGRPKKEERYLLPRQMRKDILQLLEEEIWVNTAKGRKRISRQKVLLTTILNKGIAGNPTGMKLSLSLAMSALEQRMAENGPVRLLDQLIDNENRTIAKLQDFADIDYDLKEVTRKIY